MATFTRQPFAEIGTPRLQALQSAKNRQNAISPNFASPLKPTPTASTGKRQRAPEIFEDNDSENLDPSLFTSPTKKSKFNSSDAGFVKPAKFSLFTSPVKQSISLTTSPTIPSIRKALSSPNTAKSTPITNSRGSPKHKRIHAISKHRRASSSPFRRVDPPSFTQSSPSLPFSIDAALSGTIQGYTPKPTAPTTAPASAPVQHVSTLDESMPKGWFFEIHEDTPEQEAANLMEHSASVLDISSDDDVETKKRNEDLERGKENIPPPDFLLAQPRLQTSSTSVELQIEEPVKRPRLRAFVQDAMDEDRKPLGDLPPSEFYGEGCDASSYVTVDAGIEKPSSLSKEFDFSCATLEKRREEKKEVVVEAVPAAAEEVVAAPAEVVVHVDEPALADAPTPALPLDELTAVVEAIPQSLEVLVATS
ncbi:Nn.00g081630.m01.CDS01 [Neocucurbitaria sp. VM-36]